MTTANPTFSQIKAQVTAVRQKHPSERVIGIRAFGRWTGESCHRDGEEVYVIQQCDSPLAMRLALRQPVDDKATKVLITGLEEKELGDDILIRLARRRLYQIDSWQIVRTLFQAHTVDPRLTRHSWIAETLLDTVPAGSYPPARGGFLDAETVWPLILNRTIGLNVETPDLTSILKWSKSPDALSRFRVLSDAMRESTIAWLAERAGPAVETILRAMSRLKRPDALPLGLAMGVVYHQQAAGQLEKAAGKLEERYLGGHTPAAAVIERWSAAAVEVVRLQLTDAKTKRQLVQRADEILQEIQAESFAYLSDTSPLGFDQRLADFGKRLSNTVQHPHPKVGRELQEAVQAIRNHEQASREKRRLERVEMAIRSLRWLSVQNATDCPRPQSLAEAAELHLRDGGYVDWARLTLRAGDPVGELSAAYSRLFGKVTAFREQQARHFAQLLGDWTAAGSHGNDVLPVEQILDQVIAPLAREVPVLVIVIDGMSVAVCRELLADTAGHEWIALSEPGRTFNRPGIAAIPSVTEMSRTSLLCGQRRQGAAHDEAAGFAEHPALRASSRSTHPPILFHKGSLQETDDAILSHEVRKEILSAHRKVVGVVINAVDDHLLKGQQIDTRWSRDEIKVLPALLHEARTARRMVVLVSDHGHVLDHHTQGRTTDGGGERWRPDDGNSAEGELPIQGSRVLAEGGRIIAPWSEKLRYGMNKNGYHGGINPQEMVVPIVVLACSEDLPTDWSEAPVESPAWWDEQQGSDNMIVEPVQTPSKPAKPSKKRQSPTLFDLGEEEDTQPRPVPAATLPATKTPEWVQRLLASPVFTDQKRLGGRAVPDDDVFDRLLTLLDRRGGKMTSAALARSLEFPPLRLRGLLAVMQRVLNVDGYPVLSRDDASDTIELNRDLLITQFDLA